MKRILVIAGIAIVTVVAYMQFTAEPAVNPDPNHSHADFAVWIDGEQFDFSDDYYMSAPPADATSFMPFLIPKASAHLGEEVEEHTLPGREYLHLHDGNGHVIHRHKPGLTFEDFLASLGLHFSADNKCFLSDVPLADWVKCSPTTFRMFVNGKESLPFNAKYVFADLDQILVTNATDPAQLQKELAAMTNDACLYSRTCPERGDPPAENCIADPTVPCVGS